MTTTRKPALIAGISLMVMAIAAGLSFGYIHSSLVIPTDAEVTVNNLKESKALFRIEVFGWILILVCDIAVALALYFFFKNENRELSFFTAAARLVYSAILGFAIFFLVQILNLLGGTADITGAVMSKLNAFKTAWSYGLIIFGIHLVLLGLLVLQSKLIHNFWGILLIFAGISYSFIHVSNFLFLDFETQIKAIEAILSLPMAVAEIGFAFWLIIRGGKPRTLFQKTI